MKRQKRHIMTLGLLTAILLLAACHDDALPDRQNVTVAETSSASWLNLHIVGSQATGTRATTAEENAVYDGILCVFEGHTEREALLKSATVIDQLINNPGNSTSVDITQRLTVGTHPYNDNRYVLALLNTTPTGFSVSNGTLCHHGTPLTGSTIGNIQDIIIDDVGDTSEHVGLYMSNAPQSDGTIMPLLPADCLFDTPEDAAIGSCLTISVERAAAHVSVGDETSSLTDIRLNGSNTQHPTIHRMTWTVNNYLRKSYAVRHAPTPYANWATSITDTPLAFTASDFSLWPQLSHSNDELYIAENTGATETEIIVEVQLKDQNSMLIHEGFVFHPYGDYAEHTFTDLYTTPEQYINYLKTGLPPENKGWFGLEGEENADIFKYATIAIQNDGSVKLNLHNSNFTSEKQVKLAELADFLSQHTTGFRDGKMYYTYKIKHDNSHNGVVRNNAYNLRLTNSSVTRLGRIKP